MSEKLLEADFLTIDLRALLNNQGGGSTANGAQSNIPQNAPVAPTQPAGQHKYGAGFATTDLKALFAGKPSAADDAAAEEDTAETADTTSGGTDEANTADAETDIGIISDWDAEYKRRIDENNKMDSESRQTNLEIDTKFFKEFYTAIWKDEATVVQLILLGDHLKQAFKVLGFKKETNPLYAFLSQEYVQKELLLTKLLNKVTFVPVYNAVAKNQVADSEFDKVNDYNIIYCRDFYKKSAADMDSYLNAQKRYLKPDAGGYSVDDQISNRKALFFYPDLQEKNTKKRAAMLKNLPSNTVMPKASDKNTILNDLDLVNNMAGITNSRGSAGNSPISAKEQAGIAKNLTSRQQVFAALQYLHIASGSKAAADAMISGQFGSMSAEDIAKASAAIAQFMPKGELPESDAAALVDLIMDRLADLQ